MTKIAAKGAPRKAGVLVSDPNPSATPVAAPQSAQPFDVFAAHRALAASALTAPERLVGHTLLIHMNRDGLCWPSITLLEKESALGRSTICRALKTLERIGMIVRIHHSHDTSTRYWWCHPGTTEAGGSATAGPPSATQTLPVVPQRDPGSARVAPEHLREQPKKNNQKNVGESTPQFSLGEVWQNVLRAYAERRRAEYDTVGPPEKVAADDRADIAQFFLDASEEARSEWPGPQAREALPRWVDLVVREILDLWFARSGRDDYLVARCHPLTALRNDLASVHAEWRAAWPERIARVKKAA